MNQNTIPEPPGTIYISDDTIACDGGSGPLGHPRIYMTVDHETHSATCGYCDRLFIQKGKEIDTSLIAH